MTEPENDTVQSPSAHFGYFVPPPLGAFVFRRARGFRTVSAFRDSRTLGDDDAEGSAARVRGVAGARESVAAGAASGLDGTASADDAAGESQPAMARTRSAPIAVRFGKEGGQCRMRGA
ncbi:hypothetical protein [Jidongwangia harbinensis]|uniref:hypothetical protein n=1 Tax=Jidongwangia harbinensis TaxID=2878561 RepID=UPI001CDA20CD|nr:hypothetical protein [Jidongwangia harbinensis]MCA2215993.1 hypothetical protein [Jidongwangia harbinensis]